jgi:hypothetical protein
MTFPRSRARNRSALQVVCLLLGLSLITFISPPPALAGG